MATAIATRQPRACNARRSRSRGTAVAVLAVLAQLACTASIGTTASTAAAAPLSHDPLPRAALEAFAHCAAGTDTRDCRMSVAAAGVVLHRPRIRVSDVAQLLTSQPGHAEHRTAAAITTISGAVDASSDASNSYFRITIVASVIRGLILPGDGRVISLQSLIASDDIQMTLETDSSELSSDGANVHASQTKNSGRRRRGQPRNAGSNTCGVVVDVDASYFNVWAPASAGMALAEREAILLAHLQALFDDIDHIFTGSDEFSFALQAVKIYHDAHILPLEPAKMGAGEALSLYGRLLLSMGDRKGGIRGEGSAPGPEEACVNLLLTHKNLKSTVGIAVVGSPAVGSAGGICETAFGRSTAGLMALNIAASTTLAGTRTINSWTHLVATAHELGHAYGAKHTCSSPKGDCLLTVGDPCNPAPADGGPFIMYPQITYGGNAQRISPCNRQRIRETAEAKGSCLRPRSDFSALPPLPVIPATIEDRQLSTVGTTTATTTTATTTATKTTTTAPPTTPTTSKITKAETKRPKSTTATTTKRMDAGSPFSPVMTCKKNKHCDNNHWCSACGVDAGDKYCRPKPKLGEACGKRRTNPCWTQKCAAGLECYNNVCTPSKIVAATKAAKAAKAAKASAAKKARN